MAENPTQPKKEALAAKLPSEDDRYRYIGFGVYPKGAPKFWKSDAEEQRFLERIRAAAGTMIAERDFSFLHAEVMTMIDRVVLTLTALIMIGTALMPWVQFRTIAGTDFSLYWGAALGTLFGGLSTAFASGLAVGLSALCAILMMIGGPILGLWILAVLWTKAKTPDAFLLRLRRPIKLGYVFLYLGAAVAILAFVGGRIPGFETWGLIDPGEKYGFGTLTTLASFGPYVLVAMGVVAAVKSGDL
ncbi:MAG TPA: hypothetical protein VM118_03040 [Acidobacteriota bacterium]|nr:hypothetical protein [Acidobacteriota bacterium]